MRTQRGFTLVELLVVIGIIAVLISVLLPALAGARASANNVKCLSNLKQLGMAAHYYMNEYKGILPPIAYQGQTDGSFWPNALTSGKYVVGSSNSSLSSDRGRQSVFNCPAGETTAIANNGATNGFPALTTQTTDFGQMNFRGRNFATNNNDVITTNYAANGIQAYTFNVTQNFNGRPASEYFPFCTWPSDALVAAGTAVRPAPAKVASAKQSTKLVLFFDGIYCHDRNPLYMTLRHGKLNGKPTERASNFVFADGHAASIGAYEMPSLALTDSLYNNVTMNSDGNGRWKIRLLVKPLP